METVGTINGSSETSVSETVTNQRLAHHQDGDEGHEDANAVNGNESGEPEPSDRRKEILKALEAVERDSAAIAESFSSLFASLRLSLSQATSSTVDHMNCFSDAAGRLQECVLDASTKGNRYINSCLRLNEEMKGMDALATQLKILRRHVDALDSTANKIVRFP
ncbi:hypothetical protein CDL12_12252 [Handroanthus impetiginosus]|uniref:BLOC-1-related complex subunit 6 C-terminal helix domain-containing protein n=1 Tax=Handroanthus impetiginosus TaxID=429701 RepID=A0A2G9HC48_9LAMI|nr:hypothetical protein CDL12_12252 [Handroanthus impetiginosus]